MPWHRFRRFLTRMVSKVKEMTEDENTEGKQEEEKSGKKQRVQFPQYFNKNQGTDNPNGTALKTPVLRGVVVSEFDGDRIWVEASGNMKGRYGVEVPNGYDPEDFTAGTEVALDPNTFTVTDVVDKSKDAVFNAVDTKVTFQDIGGLDNIIKAMKSNVGAQLDSDKKQKIEDWGLEMDKSILLVGRPGTGKTHLVKAVSNEYDAEMFMINGPQLVEKFIGEGAKKVKRLYEQARASDKPSIIFIDEIDAIAKKRLDDRRHGGEEVERTMSQLLSELDGLDTEEGGNVISIFASNKPDIMDPALLNRCNALEVPVPTKEAKREILQVHTRSLDLDDSVDLEIIADEMEDDYTGRDIKQIVKQAAVNALERYEDVSEAEISMQDFQEAVEDLREGNLGAEKDFLADDKMTPEEMFA
ncbi:AAA family ATPase [Candidatus Nanohalococcus occultus]|uniref:AAA family ATPase n=1 Tax=Candidatus Nanohalococcus occultus TaxID=2978047 RepID=UPI0039DFD438